jgi:hypothetical protein
MRIYELTSDNKINDEMRFVTYGQGPGALDYFYDKEKIA